MRLPVPRRFPKEGGEAHLWHTILLARSSVLYLLFRKAGKGVKSPFRAAHLYPPKTAVKNCEGMSSVWLLFYQGSRGKMKCSPRFRRNKRYIKNSNKLSFFIFDAVFLAPCGATEKHGDVSIDMICRWKRCPSPVPPRRRFPKRCFQNESTFLISRPKSLQNESTVPRFSRSSDPANDHATVGVSARRCVGRNIRARFRL